MTKKQKTSLLKLKKLAWNEIKEWAKVLDAINLIMVNQNEKNTNQRERNTKFNSRIS